MTPEMTPNMTQDQAGRLATIALAHVTREYPHGLQHVWDTPGPLASPRSLHPVFYGSYDWHSCVHAYWLLATLRRRIPGLACAPQIEALFDAHLLPHAIEAECAYLRRPAARGFERPYGWAWVLALHQALDGTRWAPAFHPLAAIVAGRFRDYLPKADHPVRVGTHFNTAFALRISAAYAAANDPALLALLTTRAWDWYGRDEACQAWEPSQDEFLSPALMEAACMRRLHPDRFDTWFAAFLPDRAAGRPATLFHPVTPSDRSDGKIAHLDGLNLSRAWCWRELGGDPAIIERHLAASLPHVAGHYMGEHWLATFAALALLEDVV